MSWYYGIIYLVTLGIALGVLLWVALFSLRHREVPATTSFALFAVLGVFGTIVEGMGLISGTRAVAQIWQNLRYLAMAFIPVAWLVFSLQYAGRGSKVSPARIVALSLMPAATQVMVWTNGLHGFWMRHEPEYVRSGWFHIADMATRVPAPWFWVHLGYSYLLLFIGIVFIIQLSFRVRSIYRRQAVALLLGTCIMTAGSVIPIFNLFPLLKINPLNQTFALSALIFAWAMFRYRFLDLVPVARDRLIELMDDAMFVIDRRNRIIDLNPAMRRLISEGFSSSGRVMPDKLVGISVVDALYPWRGLVHRFQGIVELQTEISAMVGAEERHFDLHFFPLADARDGGVERMAVLRDITPRRSMELALEQKTHELNERIKELNCLYGISEIMRTPGISMDDIIRRTIAIMPAAWQYPGAASVRFVLDDREYLNGPCAGPRWAQSADILVEGARRGMIQVCYREERPPADEGPFLTQERVLLDAIAERLGRVIERRRAEESLRLSEARLEALHAMEHMDFDSERALIEYALEEEVRLTGSEIGYFHFVKEDQVNLELYAWSKRTMENCTIAPDRHYPLDAAGVWADCARLKRAVIHNDYQGLPDKKGYPEGHSHIRRHLSVPIVHEDRVMAVSGVANKEEPYNESDVLQMELFMHGVWQILARRRATDALTRALEEKDTLLVKLEANELRLQDRNQKMEFDLMIAQTAQKTFVRRETPSLGFLNVDLRYKPMEKVGGDYFSFNKFSEGALGFFICDVSGHGVSAALYIALIKSIADRLFQECGSDPATYLQKLNTELIGYISSNFITGVYGVIERIGTDGGARVRFANGGHSFPIVARRSGETGFNGKSGMLIGVTDDVEFTVNEELLGQGDRFFVYTDGIPETENSRREMIGFEEGLLALFRDSRRDTMSDTLDAVLDSVTRFRGARPMQDDITLIGFEVT